MQSIKIPGTFNNEERFVYLNADKDGSRIRVVGPASHDEVNDALAHVGRRISRSTWEDFGEQADDGAWWYTALDIPLDNY